MNRLTMLKGLRALSVSGLILLGTATGTSAREYVIGAGDVLHISVLDYKDLDTVVTVRPDTKITFPLIGDIQAAGLTSAELADKITKELGKSVKNPNVTVSLREVGSYRIYILGKVKTPGVYHSKSEITLLQALSMAGGVAEGADLSVAYIVRGTQRIPVNLIKLLRDVDVAHNAPLMPEDTIVIPESPKTKRMVVVMGEVNKPGVFPLNTDEEMNPLQAIALAGGFTHFAAPSRVAIIRQESGKRFTLRVDVKDLIKNPETSKEILLQPGDTIVVP